MARVIFKTSKRYCSEGMAELLVRFYHSKTECQVSTGIIVKADLFSYEEQRMVVSRRYASKETAAAGEAQRKMDELRSEIYDAWMRLDGKSFDRHWLQSVVDAFNGIVHTDEVLVVDQISAYCEANDLSKGTRRQYKVLEGMLRRYGETYSPMVVDKTTSEDIAKFAHFLRLEGASDAEPISRSQNTINSKLRRLSAIFRWLAANDRCQHNPFAKYVIQSDVYGTPIYLTIQERDQLAAYPFAKECDTIQRDIFIFQCHIGCRVSDLMSLTKDNIDGDCLQYIQHKLRRSNASVVRVPLDQAAIDIIERYKDNPTGKLLPCISDVKYNVAIKRLLREAGIDRMVIVQDKKTCEPVSVPLCDVASSHLARKTFMANLYKMVKSERIVSSFTGHAAGSSAFRRYTEVDDAMKREIMDEMEGKSENKPK